MAHATTTAFPRTNIFGLVKNFLTSFSKSFADDRAYRATRNELLALSDRHLADLGLTRSMIDRAALDAVFSRTK